MKTNPLAPALDSACPTPATTRGRPPCAEPLAVLSLRLTARTLAAARTAAQSAGVPLRTWLRHAIEGVLAGDAG